MRRKELEEQQRAEVVAVIKGRIIEIERQISVEYSRLNNGIEYKISPKVQIASLSRLLEFNRELIGERAVTCH